MAYLMNLGIFVAFTGIGLRLRRRETARKSVRPPMMRQGPPPFPSAMRLSGIEVRRDWPAGCGPGAYKRGAPEPAFQRESCVPGSSSCKRGRPRKHPLTGPVHSGPWVDYRALWKPVRVEQGPRSLPEYHRDFAFAAESLGTHGDARERAALFHEGLRGDIRSQIPHPRVRGGHGRVRDVLQTAKGLGRVEPRSASPEYETDYESDPEECAADDTDETDDEPWSPTRKTD